MGRDAVRKCLKELEAAGYLIREQVHQGNGKFGGTVYTLLSEAPPEQAPPSPPELELPSDSPSTENPSTVKPAEKRTPLTGNCSQVKKHLSKETPSNNPAAPKGARPPAGLFDRFWAAYPKKQNRTAALRAWSRLCPDADLFRAMEAALRWQRETEQWKREGGRFIPSPASRLRGRRWEDQPVKLEASNEWIKDILARREREFPPGTERTC